MSKMRWHPTEGHYQVFGDDETEPEGWLDHHPEDTAKAAPSAEPAPVVPAVDDAKANKPLTKKELLAALAEGGVEVDPEAKVDELDATLSTALQGALTAAKIEFAPDASTRALLALVRNQ